jgi:hypothetical protein
MTNTPVCADAASGRGAVDRLTIVSAFAVNLQQLWANLLISIGILTGVVTIRGNSIINGWRGRALYARYCKSEPWGPRQAAE